MEYTTEYINYNAEIKRIYHISDIHINLQAKHDEYKYVFKKLFDYLKSEKETFKITNNKDIESCIVITGDILHSKTELLPECIELTRNFLSGCAKLMPTIIIAGNHDLNINNNERLDGLTPIVNGVDNDLPLYYLKKSGLYHFGNIVWSVSSVRDYLIVDPSEITMSNKIKIALFHGRVNGALLFNKSKLDGEINKKTNKTITPECFRGYDYVLMGDIHKQQFMNKEKTMAYSGSLIQQNHGESLDKHGVLVWDLENKTTRFKEIKSSHCYFSHLIKENNINAGIVSELQTKLPTNLRLRLFLNNTPNSKLQEIISLFKNYFNIIEVSYQDCSEGNESDIKKEITMNITNIDYQNKLIEEYLVRYTQSTPKVIDYVKKLNALSNKQLDENKMCLNARWKLLKLEFSNLFSYGENNIIHFKDYKGILGIIAPNHMGKSAIIDIILFTLYDKFPRKGNVKDIVNNRKRSFKSKVMFKIGGWRYVVFKSGVKTDKGRVTSKIEFYRINKENIKEILTEDTVVKTKNSILKYVGLYDDIIQTNVSLQNNNCNFIEAENTARKKELERILQVDFIDELLKKSNIMISDKKAVYKHLQNNCYEESILNLNKNIAECVRIITENDNLQKKYKLQISQLETIINQKKENIIPNIEERRNMIKYKIGGNFNLDELSKNEMDLKENKENKLKMKDEYGKSLNDYIEKNKCKTILNSKPILNITNKSLQELKKEVENENTAFTKEKNKNMNKVDTMIEELYKSIKSIHKLPINNKDEYLDIIEKLKGELNEVEGKLEVITNIQNKLSVINEEISVLNNNINSFSQEEIPNKMMDLLEETPVLELQENVENMETKLIQKGGKKNMENFKESHRQVAIYDYLENYQTEIETRCHQKEDYIKEKEEKQCTKSQLMDDLLKLMENNKPNQGKPIKNIVKDLEHKGFKLTEDISQKEKEVSYLNENTKIISNNEKINNKLDELKTVKEKLISKDNKTYSLFCVFYDICIELSQIDNELELIGNKKKRIEENIKEYQELDELYKKNELLKQELIELEQQLITIKEKESKVDYTLNVNKAEFVKNNTKMNEHKKEIENMKGIEKELTIYKVYNNALKNLPFIIIKKVVPRLERKINELLSVCTNFMVKVEINDNHIEIYIDRPIYNGSLILLNNASGFERFISSLAIRLALLDISQLPKPNFIAIDEGWTSFDYHNINNVRTIFDFLVEKFDFVLSISHLSQIKEHCSNQINLKKDVNGFSVIA